jgi:hypothetical protein
MNKIDGLLGRAGCLTLAGCVCFGESELVQRRLAEIDGYWIEANLYEGGKKRIVLRDPGGIGTRGTVLAVDVDGDGNFDRKGESKIASKGYKKKFEEYDLKKLEDIWYEVMYEGE